MTLGRPINPSESLSQLRGKPVTPQDEPVSATTERREDTSEKHRQFEGRRPRFRLSDVVLSESTAQDLEVLRSRIHYHRVLYEDWGFGTIDPHGTSVAINLYGPPGTGKTMCAEALAAELGKDLIDVSYAEIESKYVGETGKNIRAAFEHATDTGALLFFDEADSILGKRMTNVTQAADHGVNVARAVMLKQLDAFTGIVVFATNLAKNFDGAFVRRILQHVEIPLPDLPCRRRLWERMLPAAVPGRESVDLAQLATESAGLSGGEIKNAVLIGLSRAVCRAAPDRRVSTVDLVFGLTSVKRAKRDVGRYDYGATEEPPASITVHETPPERAELPFDSGGAETRQGAEEDELAVALRGLGPIAP